jgi:hypothetical protein
VWAPVAAAGIGAVAAFGAAALTQRSNNKTQAQRWEQERGNRDQQWQREDRLRWAQERQQAYARFVGALYAWDDALTLATAARRFAPELPAREPDWEEIASARREAREQQSMVQFLAPKEIRDLAGNAVLRREILAADLSAEGGSARVNPDWTKVRESLRSLLIAMRDNLGLETLVTDADSVEASDK